MRGHVCSAPRRGWNQGRRRRHRRGDDMKILPGKSDKLQGRSAPNSSAVACDCGEHFLWERGRGDRAKCPSCGKEETLNFSGATPAAMTKEEEAGAWLDKQG